MRNVLVVGGTSGIGLEIATLFQNAGDKVFVTGRSLKRAKERGIETRELYISKEVSTLESDVRTLCASLPEIHIYVHAAGFYQEGHLADQYEAHLMEMINVSLISCAFILRRLLDKQEGSGGLAGFIAITSSSATRARELEPMYCAGKAALSMLAETLSLDPLVGKVLEVAPSATNTSFWNGIEKDRSGFLTATEVANETLAQWKLTNKFRAVLLQRNPFAVIQLKPSR